MRARIIVQKSIIDFQNRHENSRSGFNIWMTQIKHVNWTQPSDIIRDFNTADNLGNGSDRIVFNIGGNKFRLICKYFFGINMVRLYVKWIGTHADYTRLCRNQQQYTIDMFKD